MNEIIYFFISAFIHSFIHSFTSSKESIKHVHNKKTLNSIKKQTTINNIIADNKKFIKNIKALFNTAA